VAQTRHTVSEGSCKTSLIPDPTHEMKGSGDTSLNPLGLQSTGTLKL